MSYDPGLMEAARSEVLAGGPPSGEGDGAGVGLEVGTDGEALTPPDARAAGGAETEERGAEEDGARADAPREDGAGPRAAEGGTFPTRRRNGCTGS